MKLNVAALVRKPVPIHTKSFPLEQTDQALFTLTVRGFDALLAYKSQDAAEEFRQLYLVEKRDFPPFGAGSAEIEITEGLIRSVCPILVSQAGAPDDNYTFEELVWIAFTEGRAWIAAQLWFDTVTVTPVEDLNPGEPSGEPTPAP
jgi:hypothetical protein